ncbi:MAG TPA: type 1 glutamine amidotransferase [Mycobacteriales bacterium]|nr:type 1 glutamine amidotransferase [Mycobacteriales bacterium]
MPVPTALVVQNDPDEPAARLGDWLVDAGLSLRTVTPYDGSMLPGTLEGYDALVVLAGGMSVNSGPTVAWFPPLRALFRQAVSAGLPTLAICLGAQLLADALGGRVAPGDAGPEIGPALVAKRDLAARDPLFGPVPFTPDVVQWHREGITELPPGAVLLASSPKYSNQAFRIGPAAYGLVFHIETTPDLVRRWAAKDVDELDRFGVQRERLLARLDEAHADVEDVWRPFTRRFVDSIRSYQQERTATADRPPGGVGAA